MLGGWICLVNIIDLVRGATEHIGVKNDYTVVHRTGDLRFIPQVVAEGKRSIGDSHPNTRTVTKRVEENPATLTVCLRQRGDGKSTFCGYVLLYPLNDALGEAVLSGAIRSESEFGANPLRGSFVGARYIYVGMIWGIDKHARWHVKDMLRQAMLEVLPVSQVECVFARPGSVFGETMMKEYGFTPIRDPDGVWSIDGKRLKRRLVAEQALHKAVIVGSSARTPRGPSASFEPSAPSSS